MRITFSSKKDGSGETNRTAFVTNPQMLEPGGWIHDLFADNYGRVDAVYDERIRQQYDRMGYGNVSLDRYTQNLAEKRAIINGGGGQEDIDYLAKMQEAAAGRNPNNVKTEYQEGGPRNSQEGRKYQVVSDDVPRSYPEYVFCSISPALA